MLSSHKKISQLFGSFCVIFNANMLLAIAQSQLILNQVLDQTLSFKFESGSILRVANKRRLRVTNSSSHLVLLRVIKHDPTELEVTDKIVSVMPHRKYIL